MSRVAGESPTPRPPPRRVSARCGVHLVLTGGDRPSRQDAGAPGIQPCGLAPCLYLTECTCSRASDPSAPPAPAVADHAWSFFPRRSSWPPWRWSFTAPSAGDGGSRPVRDRELARLSANQVTAALEHYVELLPGGSQPDLTAQDPPSATWRYSRPAADWPPLTRRCPGGRRGGPGSDERAVERPGDLLHVLGGALVRAVPLETGCPLFPTVVPDGPDGAEVVVVAVPVSTYEGGHVGVLAGMLRVAPTRRVALWRPGPGCAPTQQRAGGPLLRGRTGVPGQPSAGEAGISRILLQTPPSALQVGSDSVFLVDGQGRVVYLRTPPTSEQTSPPGPRCSVPCDATSAPSVCPAATAATS
jgi:hypothetical protein